MTAIEKPPRFRLGPALIALGVLLLVYVGSVSYRAHRLERETREEMKGRAGVSEFAPRGETRRRAEATGRIGHMEIPSIRLSAPVLEGTDPRVLQRGVGHVPRTALPGERDNAALAGHRDTHFSKLRRVEEGDTIRIGTAEGVFSYVVDSTFIVTPDRGDLLRSTGTPTLTLVTCYPFGWIGPAPKRFIVRASGVAGGTSIGRRVARSVGARIASGGASCVPISGPRRPSQGPTVSGVRGPNRT
jgi:LPXTG-site transpeptidase (sortase) family protein